MDSSADRDRRQFPLLDSEEQPRPWWRLGRLIIGAAVIVVAGLAAGVFALARSQAPAPPQVVTAPGRIAALTTGQDLVLSDPGGGHLVKLPALVQLGSQLSPALDNRYLALDDGLIVATGGRRPAMATTKIYPFANGLQGTFNDEPFADHDRQLLAVVPSPDGIYNQNKYSEFSLATGNSASLGTADGAAGDPQTPGAFVSVGVKNVSAAAVAKGQLLPDTRVELRMAGRPAAPLATAAAGNRDLGLGTGLPVSLVPFPSPSGDEVAVTVLPISGRSSGIIVLSRAGRLVAKLPPVDSVAEPVWSPSGASLAFMAMDRGHIVLDIWTVGGRLRTEPVPFPAGAFYYTPCLWSPDGKRILCSASYSKDPNAVSNHWVIARVSGGPVAPVTGPGTPVAWLP